MNFLFLTDEFYPKFGANSLLVKNIAEELVGHGYAVYVMPYSYDCTLPKVEEYNGIRVIRAIPTDGKETLKKQLRMGHWLTATKIATKYVWAKVFKPKNLKIKDNFAARQFLKDWIKENEIDCVVSINCSVEISFPLLALRKRGQLDCKWIWYMIDPFESHDYYKSLMPQKKLRKLQKKIMQACDKVIMTDEIYRDTCLWEDFLDTDRPEILKFPKIILLSQPEGDCEFSMPQDSINVLCTGSRDDEVRDSAYTLALCRKIPYINFHFMGKDWSDGEIIQEENVYIYPFQPLRVVRHMQWQADFLLNIGNKNPNQIPSKLLEYINLGKPVINIYKTDRCPTLRLLEEYDAMHISERDELEVSCARLEDFLCGEHVWLTQAEVLARYKDYTPAWFVDKLLQIIQ